MKTKSYLLLFLIFGIALISCRKESEDISSPNFQKLNCSNCNYAADGIYGDYEVTNTENYAEYEENPFIEVSEEPISTFSVDADGGSYANMRRFLNLGQAPPKEAVRIEEFINYFTFNYLEPTNGESVALNSDISTCPWNTENHLIRLGMKGKSIPENELPLSNFVFLIDVSGSMNSADKLGILKSGFKLMVDNLSASDKVAIVTYAGQAGVLLPSTNGDEKDKIKAAIEQLGAGGSTAGAQGISTAYQIAEENFIDGGNNRIILGSDGDFNVGPSSVDELIELVEEKRDNGVYITTLGVGTGNLNDHMMEQIANKGNGNYEYIDNVKQLQKVFIHEKCKFITVAKDSKIQVTFNPDMVNKYRLIGYENRNLNNEDFENDNIDAGEIGAGQTITAVYEVLLNKTDGSENYLTFDFRYKKTGEETSRPLSVQLKSTAVNIENASENMRFAAAIVGWGLIMRQSEYKGSANKQMVLNLTQNASVFDPNGYRDEFISLVQSWTE